MNINSGLPVFRGKVMSDDELSTKRVQDMMRKPGMPEPPMPPNPRIFKSGLLIDNPYTKADRERVKAAIAKNSDLVEKMKKSKIDIGFIDTTSTLYLKSKNSMLHILEMKPRIPIVESLNHFVKRIINHVLKNEDAIIEKYKKDHPYWADKI